jgi:hypothetical protein
MQNNNLFSIQRFLILFKQSLTVNKKLIGISLAGVTGTIFVLLMLFQSMSSLKYWDENSYVVTFLLFFFSIGAIYSSLSFPAFRSKERSMSYLMLPASTSEKFIFELLIRIVTFILLLPPLFWVIANLEGAVVHHYKPEFINYKFSYARGYDKFTNNMAIHGWTKIAFIQGSLFIFFAVFTGASHFSKSPLVKTLFTLSIITSGFVLYTYLLYKGLNIKEHSYTIERILFIKSKNGLAVFCAVALTVINLSLLMITWFRLKEKEV